MYTRKSRRSGFAHSSLKHGIVELVYRSGLVRLGRPLWSNWLTVVNYHRVDDANRPGFDSFRPNVSAYPEEFERQISYLAKWFNVISIEQLARWLDGNNSLSPHPALITFDDGYLDNYANAYPILRRYNLPALIFLTTDHIGTDAPFYWDLAAYCFHHTRKDSILFPDGQLRLWKDANERNAISEEWVNAMKFLPEIEKRSRVDRLPQILDVSIPEGQFRKLMMNWDHVAEMSANGIAFGGHTLNHPILTRISIDEVRDQIEGSKKRIENAIGQNVFGFAYPNGLTGDLNRSIEDLVARAGYRLAFTLSKGPASQKEVKDNPYTIRRIFISYKHTMARFASLLSPLNRLRSEPGWKVEKNKISVYP